MSDSINWSATGKVSFYRVEVASDAEFVNRVKVFSTNKTSIPLENIGQGKWFIRVSALNLQSGSWDYTKTMPITVEGLSTSPPQTAAPVQEEKAAQVAEEQQPPATEEQQQATQPENPPAAEQSTAVTTEQPVEPVNPVEAPAQQTPQATEDAAAPVEQ